ncbi:MAG: domain S-box protein [Bryobacterales bacterium]|nr:domain S-box protein [Bryobacterales bacterium]
MKRPRRKPRRDPVRAAGRNDADASHRAEGPGAALDHPLRLLAENVADVFWLTDYPPTRVIYVSPSYFTVSGLAPDGLGEDLDSWRKLIHPSDAEWVRREFEEKMAGGGFAAEYRLIRPDGAVRWIFDRAFPIRDANGVIHQVAGVAQDITLRKLGEDKLRQQWHHFDTVLSHIPDFAYTFSLDGRFTYVNRALLSLWQLSLNEAIGRNFFDLEYPPDPAARLQRQIEQVIATRQPIRDETPYSGADGSAGFYEYIFVPVFAPDHSIEAVAGSTRDITERTRAEAALRESEERFSAAFAEAPVAMVLTTPAGELVEANKAYLP